MMKGMPPPGLIVDQDAIGAMIENQRPEDHGRIREILAKARDLQGLDGPDVLALSAVTAPDLVEELFDTARTIKEAIYGSRIVLFAPLYISNLCQNECLYCAFRVSNRSIQRRRLSQQEIAEEVRILVEQGHKRLLLVAGEGYPAEGFDYILKSLETVYGTQSGRGEIRRVNVNLAPLDVAQFRQLKAAGIGTYQLFQETYHRETYGRMHPAGPKSDFDWRITAPDRAMEGGIDDIGTGVLFGLYDWRYEVLALLQHARHLEAHFGVGPHTISVPRIEPAAGSEVASRPPHPVDDGDFKKIVAILRLAVPYTGIILSTRESPELRREVLALGVSQISAGSRTNPGGYSDGIEENDAQFQLGDHRTLDEVVLDLAEMGYIPSFCTACYRSGRTGADFMSLAKPGAIKNHCGPNALATFLEYLLDYASPETLAAGRERIQEELARLDGKRRRLVEKMLDRVASGERDVFI